MVDLPGADGPRWTTPDRPDVLADEWARAHVPFHAATMSACGSVRLVETVAELGECAALYRHWSHRYDHVRDVAAEHRAIFDATLARDTDRATHLHVQHIRRTADIVIAALAVEADPIGGGAHPDAESA